MKKLFVMFALVSFALVVKAGSELSYVSVDGKVYFSEDVRVGLTNVRISTDNGMILKAPIKKVDAIMMNGKLYERLPLICCNGKVKGSALLEFVSQRNGLRLYKYHTGNENKSLGCCFYDGQENGAMYFIYKDGELHLRINEKNAETVFDFFRVKIKVAS